MKERGELLRIDVVARLWVCLGSKITAVIADVADAAYALVVKYEMRFVDGRLQFGSIIGYDETAGLDAFYCELMADTQDILAKHLPEEYHQRLLPYSSIAFCRRDDGIFILVYGFDDDMYDQVVLAEYAQRSNALQELH